MKVHVEAKPLHEPLVGGSAGATVTVEPIIAGHITLTRSVMEGAGARLAGLRVRWAMLTGSSALTIPIPVFLIRHPSAGAILVDTGLHPSIATGSNANFGKLATRGGKPQLEPGEDVPAQLRDRGLETGEIPIVVMTHLHLDHTSGIAEFPQSTFVVSEVEWHAAASGVFPLLNSYRPAHFDYAFEYRTIDFDRSNIDSYSGFGRTFDLLGDGSVRLAFTPGHSAGHMSVICRLKERDFVIGGDALYLHNQLEEKASLPPIPHDAHNLRRSLQEIRLFHREYPDAVITPGHDPDFYAGIEKRYE